eukprot:gnl/TRDRNA2_/TRDRNA2_152433_c0_seq1.p1 gnl/TRDRNA2_/TRDRNA2_152433_c0~~gnl/TRDRNA2_/TRDRNA2_152433_c0_seq1.p1  ORF type:complete len:115 (-),score=23.44 gnl/TRDRNA2_/TRDRNA2_152433_c0_seq1:96-440(-)
MMITVHVPNTSGPCLQDGAGACGDLSPLPLGEDSHIDFRGDSRHNYFFTPSALLSPENEARTGVKLKPVADPFSADILVCNSKGTTTFKKLNKTRKFVPLIVIVEVVVPKLARS